MGSDRQDFLERKEARQRRLQQRSQQKTSASRPAVPGAGGAQSRRPSSDRSAAAPQGKADAARSAGEAAKAPGGAQQSARAIGSAGSATEQPRTKPRGDGQAAKAAQRQTLKPASTPAGSEEQSLTGGLAGRRTAARREQSTGARAANEGPKPSLLARMIVWGTMAICALLILATLGEAWTVHRLNGQVNASQQAYNQLQGQNQAIATQIAQLQQPETIEQEARRLGYIYPGDQPVVVATTQPGPTTTQKPAPSVQNWWGFWPDWLKLFFGG